MTNPGTAANFRTENVNNVERPQNSHRFLNSFRQISFIIAGTKQSMIRKIGHITFIFLLLILTTGITVSKHYCGDKLVNVAVMTGAADNCSGDDSTCNMDGCCHNENHVYQLQEEYTSPFVLDHVAFFPVELAAITMDLLHENLQSEANTVVNHIESPPPKLVSERLSDIQVYRL
jgi:hypothetical protein